MLVEVLLDGRLPPLLARRVAVHDLLRAQLDDLLEADDDHLGLRAGGAVGEEPRAQVLVDAVAAAVDVVGADPDVDDVG